MTLLFFRTLITLSLLFVVLRFLGKRQLGELETSELVSTLLLSELAALPIENPDIPLFFALIPILLISTLEVVFSHLKNKCDPLKSVFESKPLYLIEHGVICQKALIGARLSLNELISECRLQGVGDLSDIDFAILEQNGQLAILLKPEKQPLTVEKKPGETMHSVVIDGKIDPEGLHLLEIDERRVKAICKKKHVALSDVFLLTIGKSGAYHLIQKEKS
jgi:uncharacterized membrane protein YcaP (DUF421 family)